MSPRPRREWDPDRDLLDSPLETTTDPQRIERMRAELEQGFAALSDVVCGVSVFGSARTPPEAPDYALGVELGRRLGEAGFAVITGGGPGGMEAANRGAHEVGALSVGLTIDLPLEEGANPYVDRRVHFHYFFARKVMFVRYACAFVVLPGGLGTLDELFEALTLIQTRKVRSFPVVLVGTAYWGPLVDWLRDSVLAGGKISQQDVELFTVTDSLDEVLAIVRAATPSPLPAPSA